MSTHHSRRNFFLGLGAGAAALGLPFFERETRALDSSKALRLVILQTPDGRPPQTWVPEGTSTDFTLGSSLRPFDSLKDDMVIMSGVDILRGGGEPHCQAFCTWMTGVRPRDTVNNYTAARAPSFDQVVAKEPSVHGDRTLSSLQLAGDMTTVSFDISHRYMSWAGEDQPLPGTHEPLKIYQLLFSGLVPGDDAEQQAALARTIRRRSSVLDLLGSDLTRLLARTPSAQRPNLEAHLTAIRELEGRLGDATLPPVDSCAPPDESALPRDDAFPERYRVNLEMLRMALVCDLSRVVTFMSSPTTSNLRHHKWIPEVNRDAHHHDMSHGGDVANLDRVGLWYSQEIANFITSLKETPDGDGSLLDHTIVLYGSELGYGMSHVPSNVPLMLFGNAGGQLETGRYLNFLDARRSTNDLWVSIANLLGLPWDSFGDADKNRGRIPGLI